MKQNRMLRGRLAAALLGLLTLACASDRSTVRGVVPDGYWTENQVQNVLARTLELRFAPDLSGLSESEQAALGKLLCVGEIFQQLHERALHHQAQGAYGRLLRLHEEIDSAHTQGLLDLYRLNQGPIATTLDNRREPFLPVDKAGPGKNVYPWGLERESLDELLEERDDLRPTLLHLRSVVRRLDARELSGDLATLSRFPALDLLHPGLKDRLRRLRTQPEGQTLYAVPYSVAFAAELTEVFGLLNEAAELMEPEDPEFAGYLRHRARDLLVDDYEAGDAAWVSGRFGRLNAQLGAYETYDDGLYGVKAFFGASLLLKDQQRSAELNTAISGLQKLEDSLPCSRHGKVREEIPVGVYNVIADFGQARSTNTATILPNEAHITAKYGRTILLRYNVMTDPQLFEIASGRFQAAVDESQHADLKLEGNFYRTLWHEIGHYLGPKTDRAGRTLDVALEENSDLIEELKSDLVSLFAARLHRGSGYYDAERLRSVRASGVLRVLQSVKPRRSQPYQTMQLMQWNFFLEQGLLAFDSESGKLHIDYDRYHAVVEQMLEQVLDIQARGDKAAADAFIERYAVWDEELHGRVAKVIRDQQTYRFRLVRYGVLGE